MSGAPSDESSGLSFVLVIWTASVQYSKFAAGPRQLLILTRRRGHLDPEIGHFLYKNNNFGLLSFDSTQAA
jgi:hypothetical protein